MKCLIIYGSPRKGHTWKIVTHVKQKLKTLSGGESIEFEEVMLMDVDIPLCRGCFSCFYSGEKNCPHAKKVNPIVQKLMAADMLIITSPVYALNVSGLLKNFIDHTAYFYHRPAMFQKKALVITSTAGAAAYSTARYIRDTLKHWGFNRVYTISVINRGSIELSDKQKIQCDTIAKNFFDDARSKKLYPPTFKRIMFYNIWRTLASMPNATKADSDYWNQTGLIRNAYSAQIPLSNIKKMVGNMIHKGFAKMLNPR